MEGATPIKVVINLAGLEDAERVTIAFLVANARLAGATPLRWIGDGATVFSY